MIHPGIHYSLILISGPARAGKNRAGTCISEWLQGDHFALSNMLKRMTHAHYGMGTELPPLHFEDVKDLPAPQFGGLSPRQAYIRFSEGIMKPKYGGDYLGRVAATRVAANKSRGRVSIVSGVGFRDEVAPMVAAAGAPDTLHVRIKPIRNGAPGTADSRRSIGLASMGVDSIDLVNRSCGQLIGDLERSLDRLPRARSAGAGTQADRAAFGS